MLLIKNGYVMDPESGREGTADILVDGGRIIKIGERLDCGGEGDGTTEVYDASGFVVAPGLVDVHVHFRDPGQTHKEDIVSGSQAAAKGGFTTVVLMANTKPPVDNADILDYVIEKGRRTGIHVRSCAAVTKGMQGKELVSMADLKEKGAVGFTDDGVPLMDRALVRRAMEEAARLGVPLSFHEENPEFIGSPGINEGKISAELGIRGADRKAETDLVERDLGIALETGAVINIQHISSREAVELVRKAKKKGNNIHAEASPHHFTLTEEAVLRYGTLAKINPPLREEADRLAIQEGLKDGTIDLIATDHAPHSEEEKAASLTAAPSGITGLETALPLGITSLVRTGCLTMMQLLQKMTVNPARLYHLEAGGLQEGGPADLVIFDAQAREKAGNFVSKSCNSPFIGEELWGVVKCTVCEGKIVYSRPL